MEKKKIYEIPPDFAVKTISSKFLSLEYKMELTEKSREGEEIEKLLNQNKKKFYYPPNKYLIEQFSDQHY